MGYVFSGKAKVDTSAEDIKKAQRRLDKAAQELNRPHSLNTLLAAKRKYDEAKRELEAVQSKPSSDVEGP